MSFKSLLGGYVAELPCEEYIREERITIDGIPSYMLNSLRISVKYKCTMAVVFITDARKNHS